MEISNIIIQDTNGDLAEDLFKNHPDENALSAWFETINGKKVLKLSTNNIRFDSIPNIANATYKTFLTYNGSLDYPNKLFSTVVAQDKGVFSTNNIPVLTYDPYNVIPFSELDQDTIENVIIDIKMYNGVVDVLSYRKGELSYGTKGPYYVESRRSFPTKIEKYPNSECNKIYLDGWYSYTHIIFRDFVDGELVIADNYYARDGIVFKASVTGLAYKHVDGYVYIVEENDSSGTPVKQVENDDYIDLLFSLNETTGISPQSNQFYLHSQVLVLEEIRNAIINEVVDISCNCGGECDLMAWQNLMLKRTAAYVMFENGLFEKAQIIVESARSMCMNSESYKLNC